ncbi:hypothetical protein L1987_63905 [Smallanthus sonchifolius]|uniref:Uncharacterized protein n=1 Tax=Smallanthus sonchifolius TaxID=185202 RepID=A0ACB9CEH7_9ASTR|nr:hypothetical protein L1987_63905 [Smallanthus sonchifolius]
MKSTSPVQDLMRILREKLSNTHRSEICFFIIIPSLPFSDPSPPLHILFRDAPSPTKSSNREGSSSTGLSQI